MYNTKFPLLQDRIYLRILIQLMQPQLIKKLLQATNKNLIATYRIYFKIKDISGYY